MINKSKPTSVRVFGYTVDDGSKRFQSFLNELSVGIVDNILCDFSSRIEIPEECIYVFFKSTYPLVIHAMLKGKAEFVGKYPIGTSRYVYRFIPTEIIESGFLTHDNNEEGDNWVLIKMPEISSES